MTTHHHEHSHTEQAQGTPPESVETETPTTTPEPEVSSLDNPSRPIDTDLDSALLALDDDEPVHRLDPLDPNTTLEDLEKEAEKDEKDDLSEEEAAEADPSNDGLITLSGMNIAQIDALIEREVLRVGTLQFREDVRHKGTYANTLFFARVNYGEDTAREQTALRELTDEEVRLFMTSYRDPNDPKIAIGAGPRGLDIKPGQVVSGEEAIAAIARETRGDTRRVPLYNSGFYIDIRRAEPEEFATLFNKCKISDREYGRTYGALYFHYADLVLKQHFFDFLIPLIMDSSYKGWKTRGALLSRIRYPDFNAILLHVIAMSYPKGYENFQIACSAPPKDGVVCNHVERVTIDPINLILNRFAVLNEEAINHMASSRRIANRIGDPELEAYQKALGFDGFIIETATRRLTMKVPTALDYLIAGTDFNKDLLTEVQADNETDVIGTIRMREMKLFLPWVARLTTKTPDGKDNIITTDSVGMAYGMSHISKEEKAELKKKILKYINDVQISHVCFKARECPACHQMPLTESGFLTVDVASAFFTLAFRAMTSEL